MRILTGEYHIGVAKEFLSKATLFDPNVRNSRGRTALMQVRLDEEREN